MMWDVVSTHEASKIKAGGGKPGSGGTAMIIDRLEAADLRQRASRLLPPSAAADLRASGEGRVSVHRLPDAPPLRDAAVLIGLTERPDAGGLDIVLIRRTADMRVHSGEVALPGGKIDDEDNSPVEAALREADEEVGLDPGMVDPLGLLAPYPTPSGFRIFPVVGLIRGRPRFVANPGEVAEVFRVPLAFIADPGNHREESFEHPIGRRHYYVLQYGPHRIWGVTGNILHRFYEEMLR